MCEEYSKNRHVTSETSVKELVNQVQGKMCQCCGDCDGQGWEAQKLLAGAVVQLEPTQTGKFQMNIRY